MNPRLQRAQHLLRQTGLVGLAEEVRYGVSLLRTRRDNAAFVRENPGFALPPKHLAFDAYSAPAWRHYQESGEETARFLAETILGRLGRDRVRKVLDWGCGPGRVIRHLPAALGPSVHVCGSDFNEETVAWCRRSLPGVDVVQNALIPPLPYEAGSFDAVYSISVLTHLSARTAAAWMIELRRVLRPGALLILSTNGSSRLESLLPEERSVLEAEGIVIRERVREGTKMFGAFHHPRFVRERLLRGFDSVEHAAGGFPHVNQDLWLARKPLR